MIRSLSLAPTAREQQHEAVEDLFRAHAAFVWRTLHRMGIAEADLPDLLQEVFVIVQRKLPGFDGRAKATTWLFAIAARVASNHRRAARHRREALVADPPEGSDTGESPETATARAEARALLVAALETLAPAHRAVLVMFELEELECEAIAAELGIPVGTVHSRLHTARRRVLAALPAHMRGEE